MSGAGATFASAQIVGLRSCISTSASDTTPRAMSGPATISGIWIDGSYGTCFCEQAVIAQHFAMIAGEYDNGVVQHIAHFKRIKQHANLIVY